MAKRKNITTTQLALMTAAAVISLRGLPMMAQEELTMFFYIFFATFLFLIPAALVGAELGSAFADRGGGVYTWVKEAFNRHLGFSAIFLQWIQNVVWYPTVLGFAAASIAYMIGVPALAQNGLYVGLFSIAMYWCATLVTLRGTSAISGITSKGFLIGTVLPGVVVIVMAVIWMAGGNEIALKEIPAGVSQIVNVDAAQHVSLGIRESLAVLEGELGSQLIHVGMNEADPLHDDADALLRVQCRPTRLCLSGFRNNAVHVGLVRESDGGLLLTGRRIEDGLRVARRSLECFSVDVVINSAHCASPSWNLRLPVWLGSHTNVE